MDSRFVEVDGLRVHYLEGGLGEAIVLLHGGMESAEHGIGPTNGWVGYYPSLTPNHRVVAVDSRGHGATVNPSGQLTYAGMAGDVIGLCRNLGLRAAVFWGLSDGANIALEVGMQAPEIVRALVLHGPVIEFSDTYMGFLSMVWGTSTASEPPDPDTFEKRFPDTVERWRLRHPAQGPDHWRELLRAYGTLFTTPLNYTDADFDRITAPTLVVTGDRVLALPLDEQVRLMQRLPNAELAVLPGLDHERPSNPRPYVAMVEDFLARHPAG